MMVLDPTICCEAWRGLRYDGCSCLNCRIKRRDDEVIEAERRADRLLKAFLSSEEWGRYMATSRVNTSIGSCIYSLVNCGYNWRVMVLCYTRGHVRQLCVDTSSRVPPSDAILAYLLWIRSNLGAFLHIANVIETRSRCGLPRDGIPDLI